MANGSLIEHLDKIQKAHRRARLFAFGAGNLCKPVAGSRIVRWKSLGQSLGSTQEFSDFPRSRFAALQPESARLVIRKNGVLGKSLCRSLCGFSKELGPAQSFENRAQSLAIRS